jgi:hypothetical protein
MPASISYTTTTPCPCCSLPNTLQCRTRSGSPTLCGHSEIVNASTPPKKYRVCTFTGTLTGDVYSGGSCSGGIINTFVVATSGAAEYSSSTCSLISQGVSAVTETPPGTTTNFDLPGPPYGSADNCEQTVTASSTSITRTATAACCPSGASNSAYRSGSRTATLTTEDTEADAITRFEAATAWGSWINSGGVGCTGTPPSCCLAGYETRTSGFSFAYAEAEARVTATGLTPSTGYTAKIELYRRPYGSGTYAHYQTATVTGTSDGSGNLTTSAATVTNTKGYETYAASSSLFLT